MMTDCIIPKLSEERESVVLQLRSLAAQLDDIDRQLIDVAWHQRDRPAELMRQHVALTSRLRRLAERLRRLDGELAGF